MKGKRNHITKPADRRGRPDAPIKHHQQKSRKGTKAWRKNIDIDEVTTGLEKLREQKIQGGVLAEQPNEALFRVDLGGDHSVIKRERLGKTLRADEILALKSAIAPISGLAHKNSALGSGIINKKRKGPLPPSELLRLKKIAHKVANASNGSNAAASLVVPVVREYDVWDSVPPEVSPDVWVEPPMTKKPPTTYGQPPLTLTHGGQKLPAIEVAEAGQSYNPPITEWNELIDRKADEQAKLDAAQLIRNKKSRAAQGVDERFETTVGASNNEDEDDDEEEEEQMTGLPAGTKSKARATAKTQTQRNKEARRARQLEIEAAIRARKAERQALASIGDLIDSHHALTGPEKASLARDVKIASALRKHKFGKHSMPLDPLEIQLSDELAESLRTLKPEGNLFKDRFISLVKRGILESRVPQSKRRRYALLQKEKYSHKYEAGRPFMA